MKRTIQINHDLRAPGRNYQPVYDYLRSFYGWDHVLESLWLVRTYKTVAEVRDEMRRMVDANDRVAIFDVTNVAWATNFSNSQAAWLENLDAA